VEHGRHHDHARALLQQRRQQVLSQRKVAQAVGGVVDLKALLFCVCV
jgi:hypothetical protein